MFLDIEEWKQYVGYKHLNVVALGTRDPDDMEDPDLAGLERILYDVGLSGVTHFYGINPYCVSSEAAEEAADDSEENEWDYETVSPEHNPFEADYDALEDEFEHMTKYMLPEDEGMVFVDFSHDDTIEGPEDFDYEDADEQEPAEPIQLNDRRDAEPDASEMKKAA